MRRLVLLSVAMTMLTMVSACGLPDNDDFQAIDQSQDGFGLSETSTTTTTMPPTTTVDATTSTVGETTTSTIAPTDAIDIYYPSGNQLTAIPVQLPPNPVPNQVIAWVFDGPPPEYSRGVRLVLPKGEEFLPEVTKQAGVVTVDLPEALFERVQSMNSVDQQLVFGQIVLTLCGLPGVGQVKFMRDGVDMVVFRGNSTTTEAGEAVSADDYAGLTSSPPVATTTTTAPPVVVTITSPPPVDPPAETDLVDTTPEG
jgi:Sporulation and spore germination